MKGLGMSDVHAQRSTADGWHPAMKPLAALMTALTVALFSLTLMKNHHAPTDGAIVAPQFQHALPAYAPALAACPQVDSADDMPIAFEEHSMLQ